MKPLTKKDFITTKMLYIDNDNKLGYIEAIGLDDPGQYLVRWGHLDEILYYKIVDMVEQPNYDGPNIHIEVPNEEAIIEWANLLLPRIEKELADKSN